MQKSTISVGGVDYIVRTVDVRSIPTFGDECYACVDVAEHALWDAVGSAIEAGDYDACKIDDLIFFYVEDGLLSRDATDEEIVNFIRENIS